MLNLCTINLIKNYLKLKIKKMETVSKRIQESVNDLNNLIITGKVMEAFEKYYAEDVTMQENENEPTIGKVACRVNEEAFVNGITDFRKAVVKNCSRMGI